MALLDLMDIIQNVKAIAVECSRSKSNGIEWFYIREASQLMMVIKEMRSTMV